MNHIAIIGAGSHTRSSINLLRQYFENVALSIYDDSYNTYEKEYIHNIKLIGSIKDISKREKLFLSIGDNKIREEFYIKYNKYIIEDNLFHSTSCKENNISLGKSNQVFANVYINSYVEIGNNNIINTSAILEHEVKIGSHNHISVGAKLCGRVKIGNRCLIGAGAVIIDKISICNDVIIGAGAVVVKDICESGTYVGNPARKIK